jgi:hypothetical protein
MVKDTLSGSAKNALGQAIQNVTLKDSRLNHLKHFK